MDAWRPSRARACAKWALTLAALFCTVGFFTSGFGSLEYAWNNATHSGAVGVGEGGVWAMRYAGASRGQFDTRAVRLPKWHMAMWFQFVWDKPMAPTRTVRVVFVPLWAPALLTIPPALLLWRSDIRRRLWREGLCRACFYDRKGLAPDAPCPECGTTPAAPVNPPADPAGTTSFPGSTACP